MYRNHVGAAASMIQPDHLSVDLYGFREAFLAPPRVDGGVGCYYMLTDMMSKTFEIIREAAKSIGSEPIVFLQNYVNFKQDGWFPPKEYLHWYSSWSLAHGIKRFSYFISHDIKGKDFYGLLQRDNTVRPNVYYRAFYNYKYTAPIIEALSNADYLGFVGPDASDTHADSIISFKSNSVIAGEYEDTADDMHYIVLVKYNWEESIASTQVIFNQWFGLIEILNLKTGVWEPQTAPLHNVIVPLEQWPVALIRVKK